MDPSKTTPTNVNNDDQPSGNNGQTVDTAAQRPASSSAKSGEGEASSSNQITRDFMKDFIRRVQTVPQLYDPLHEGYKRRAIKRGVWRQIGEEIGQNANWCRRKWKGLRDYYVNKKRCIAMGNPGTPWVHYGDLQFLNCHYGPDEPDLSDNIQVTQIDSARGGKNRDAASASSSGTLEPVGTKRRRIENGRDQESSSNSNWDHLIAKEDGGGSCTEEVNFREQGPSSREGTSSGRQVKEGEKGLLSPSDGAARMSTVVTRLGAYEFFGLSVAAHLRDMPKARAMQMQIKISELIYRTEFPVSESQS